MDLIIELIIWLLVVLVKFVIGIFKFIGQLFTSLLPNDEKAEKSITAPPQPMVDIATTMLDEVRTELAAVAKRSNAIANSIVRDRASEKFQPALKLISEKARKTLSTLSANLNLAQAKDVHSRCSFVLDQIEDFVAQRKHPDLRHRLGDADALAESCYRPFAEFAAVNRVVHTKAVPFTLLTDFDLSIWTQLVPFRLLPIFLPPRFLDELAWWPALAHEIGHAVFASAANVDRKLRSQLGLPSEEVGTIPLQIVNGSVDPDEFVRVTGGWFEEIFSDIFGTLMLGPAYCHTMVALFAPRSPTKTGMSEILLDESQTRYGVHPPRHLRVLICSHVLRLVGEEQAAEQVIKDWDRANGVVEDFAFPTTVGMVGIPVSVLTDVAFSLTERLYRDPLDAFDGHALSAIPALDYGPAKSAVAQAVEQSLLSGRSIRTRSARSIIAGAVLAWKKEPKREKEFLRRAMRAVVGASEWAEKGEVAQGFVPQQRSPQNELRDAFLTHLVLAPPKALKKRADRMGRRYFG